MVLPSGVIAPPNSSRGVETTPSPTICGGFSGGAGAAKAPRSTREPIATVTRCGKWQPDPRCGKWRPDPQCGKWRPDPNRMAAVANDPHMIRRRARSVRTGLPGILVLSVCAVASAQQPHPQVPPAPPPSPLSVTPAAPLSADEAVRLALQQASTYQQATLNEHIAAEDVRQARAAFLPRVGATLSFIHTSPARGISPRTAS